MISERLMKLGSFAIPLVQDTPVSVRREFRFLDHIVVMPTWIESADLPATAFDDSDMLSQARYCGVLRKMSNGRRTLEGCSNLWWLGDEEGKGYIADPIQDVQSFPDWIDDALVDETRGFRVGTVTDPGGTLTHDFIFQTPRAMLDFISSYFDTEYRANADFTLDAGPADDLFVTEPTALVVRRGVLGDGALRGVNAAGLGLVEDVEDWSTDTYVIAQGTAGGGGADSGHYTTSFSPPTSQFATSGPRDNEIHVARLADGATTESSNAIAVATSVQNLHASPRQALTVDLAAFDVRGDIATGDTILAHDPDQLVVDETNQVDYEGGTISPMALRVYAMSWPVQRGMGVYYRRSKVPTVGTDLRAEWIDLTPYVAWEGPGGSLEVGAARLPLSSVFRAEARSAQARLYS